MQLENIASLLIMVEIKKKIIGIWHGFYFTDKLKRTQISKINANIYVCFTKAQFK